jgi:sugar lactone lactonase YvrE
MCQKIILYFLSLTFCVLSASSIQEFSGYDDFLNSPEIRNISITAEGKILLGPSVSLIYNTEEPYVWALVYDQKGNIFVGTGSDGKIFRINPDGKGEVFFDSEETEILSLALDQQGNLYAGTAPKGIVYKISPSGKAKKFFETNENYVFALVFDDKGFLYIGTGDKGNIYRIDKQGKGEIIFDSPEPHITALVFSPKPKPTLFAGSSGQGLIYKIVNPASNPEIMTIYDAAEEEIRALLIDNQGNIFCGANAGTSKPMIQKSEFLDITKSGGFMPKVYQLNSDGLVKQSWQSVDSIIFALQTYGKEILVGTGNSGRIYRLDKEGISKGLGTLSLTIQEPQATVFGSGPAGSILIGTGNSGKIYRLKPDMNKEGWLAAKPFDAKTLSQWGKLSYEGETPTGTNIEFQTRSGNSEDPDENWSQFQPIAGNTDIQSPTARFLQWKVTLNSNTSTTTPILSSIAVSYLPTNLPPAVYSVEITQEGSESDDILKLPGPSLRLQDRKINWTAFDPNGDSLFFNLYYKGIEEKDWKTLKLDLKDKNYVLDGEMFPDGKYQVKVIASDKPSQPLGSELTGEIISEPFEIDNTPPQISDLTANHKEKRTYLITFKVADQSSIIKSCEYSINASDWQDLSPIDKIFDTKTENFSFAAELSPGENTVIIRATDELKNVGSGKTVVNVKKD